MAAGGSGAPKRAVANADQQITFGAEEEALQRLPGYLPPARRPAHEPLLPTLAAGVLAMLCALPVYIAFVYGFVLPRLSLSDEAQRARTVYPFLDTLAKTDKKGAKRVLVLGSSLAAEGFDAHHAERLAAARGDSVEYFNLGLHGSSSVVWLPLLPGMTRARADVVVVLISFMSLNRYRVPERIFFEVMGDRFEGFGDPSWQPILDGLPSDERDAIVGSLTRPWLLWCLSARQFLRGSALFEAVEYTHWRSDRLRGNWKDPWILDRAPLRTVIDGQGLDAIKDPAGRRAIVIDPNNPLWELDGPDAELFEPEDYLLPVDGNPSAQAFLYILDRLQELRDKEGTRLVLVSMPISPAFLWSVDPQRIKTYESFLAEQARARKLSLFKLDDAYPPDHFVDEVHMSAAGRRVFSDWLSSAVTVALEE